MGDSNQTPPPVEYVAVRGFNYLDVRVEAGGKVPPSVPEDVVARLVKRGAVERSKPKRARKGS